MAARRRLVASRRCTRAKNARLRARALLENSPQHHLAGRATCIYIRGPSRTPTYFPRRWDRRGPRSTVGPRLVDRRAPIRRIDPRGLRGDDAPRHFLAARLARSKNRSPRSGATLISSPGLEVYRTNYVSASYIQAYCTAIRMKGG